MQLESLALVLALMLVLAVVETLIPFRQHSRWRRDHLRANLGLTVGALALNLGLGVVAALGADVLVARDLGLLRGMALSPAAMLVVGVVLLDLATFTPTARAAHVEYGLHGYDRPDTHAFSTLLRLPLREPPLVSSR
jgi:hypothetical protein